MKPDNPIVYNEFYLDAMTGGSSELPAPVTPEQHYLAHLAGMTVTLPQPVILRDMFLAKICGMGVDVPTYIPGKFPRKFAYYAKAAGQDVDVPQPITREEMYWFDYVSGQPSEKEYTGAVPVTFTADGTPLLDYLISGNTAQSGTPTPDNPIMPQGTGERTGNLLDFDALKNAPSGIIGSITFPHVLTLQLNANTYYTMASNGTGSASSTPADLYRSVYFNATTGESSVNKNNPVTVLTDSTGVVGIGFFSERTNAQQYLNGEAQLWINEGSTALPYEPYGYKIPISSANTTTPIYLGEVETTRKVKKLVLDGTENWTYSSAYTRFMINLQNVMFSGIRLTPIICTHYITIDDGRSIDDVPNNAIYMGGSVDLTQLFIKTDDYTTAADFKAYLAQQYAAGTPVTVWYVLATEETGIVNEPLMKIGEYADTLSMEQSNVEIPTARGTNTLDVLTDVKPSEIYIKYEE